MSQWLSTRMLEFNFLPSKTLHPSRFNIFSMPCFGVALRDKPQWNAAFHRHCSQAMLKMLGLSVVKNTSQVDLAVGLLSVKELENLARFVGISIVSPTLKHSISGDDVRVQQLSFGHELLSYARRRGLLHIRDLALLNTAEFPESLEKVEAIGYSALLSGFSQSESNIAKRLELKIPLDVSQSATPLSSQHAWVLCMAILKDMDPVWCSSFPEIR